MADRSPLRYRWGSFLNRHIDPFTGRWFWRAYGGSPNVDRDLAHLIRNEIIAGAAPYWSLDGDLEGTTADEVRREVDPILTAIIYACTNVIGDGHYPELHHGSERDRSWVSSFRAGA